jgi:hypothetical protein
VLFPRAVLEFFTRAEGGGAMMTDPSRALVALVAGAVVLAGCAPRLARVVSQGELLRTDTPELVAQARVEGEMERERLTDARLVRRSPHWAAARRLCAKQSPGVR